MLEFFKRKSRNVESVQKTAPKEMRPPEPQAQEILKDWDKKILEEGLTNVVQEMQDDFNGKLPDAIILPDTSARPLFYALAPVFRRLKEQKGIPAPRFYFFSSERLDVVQSIAEQGFEHEGGKDTIDTMEELKSYLKSIGYSDSMIESQVAISDPERMKAARDTMKERANEVLAYESRYGARPNIAVVDDYSTEGATTAGEMRRAFNLPDMHVYTVFGQSDDATQPGVIIDPFERETMNPARDFKAKLTYSGRDEVGVFKNAIQHEKYAERTKPAYKEDASRLAQGKEQLRKEMRAIGEKIAEKLVAAS